MQPSNTIAPTPASLSPAVPDRSRMANCAPRMCRVIRSGGLSCELHLAEYLTPRNRILKPSILTRLKFRVTYYQCLARNRLREHAASSLTLGAAHPVSLGFHNFFVSGDRYGSTLTPP